MKQFSNYYTILHKYLKPNFQKMFIRKRVETAREKKFFLHRHILIKVDLTIKPKFKLPIIDTNHFTK